MKKIPKPELKSATVMGAFDMNKVHFSKTRTVLTPEQLDKIANGQSLSQGSSSSSGLSDPIPKMGASDPIPRKNTATSEPVSKPTEGTLANSLESGSASEIKK